MSDCQVLEYAGIPGQHDHLCCGRSGDFSTGIFGSRDTRLDVYGRPLLWHCRHKVTDTIIIKASHCHNSLSKVVCVKVLGGSKINTMTLVRVSDFFPVLVSTLAFTILLIVSASNVSLFSHLPERGKYLLPASLSLATLYFTHTHCVSF